MVTLGMIIIVNLLGHAFPPMSIFLSPVVIALSAVLLLGTGYGTLARVGLLFSAVVINDLLMKNMAGGTHDTQGAGWINLMLIIGVILSAIICLILFLSEKISGRKIIASLLGFTLFSALYVNYFAFHGMGVMVPSSDTMAEAKDKGHFIRAIRLDGKLVADEGDTVALLSGWLEREVRIDHTGLIKRLEPTGYVLGFIPLEKNSDRPMNGLYYKQNSSDVNGARPMNDIIRFRVLESDSIVHLTFFDVSRSIRDAGIIKVISVPLAPGADTQIR